MFGAGASLSLPLTGKEEQLHYQHYKDMAQYKHKENLALDVNQRALATLMSPGH